MVWCVVYFVQNVCEQHGQAMIVNTYIIQLRHSMCNLLDQNQNQNNLYSTHVVVVQTKYDRTV